MMACSGVMYDLTVGMGFLRVKHGETGERSYLHLRGSTAQ